MGACPRGITVNSQSQTVLLLRSVKYFAVCMSPKKERYKQCLYSDDSEGGTAAGKLFSLPLLSTFTQKSTKINKIDKYTLLYYIHIVLHTPIYSL